MLGAPDETGYRPCIRSRWLAVELFSSLLWLCTRSHPPAAKIRPD